ncbi:type II toxin-antitoxin system RelE/ParE family toxin [Pectobacterium aroidearum]|uniref:Type II toxin-antitoxin system RelE/ParE family toxin n=1 Tax=Pectobacterium aroidearum TaxID=1201031 RepID=A0ABR5ZJL9_9GAMM|nr:type II toxin-antitoxin system RelE/ParE family toxin [Pectobacterium aroidearum]MBA5234775.1 type II toxin-antitoxin system RelE/ParE family toxin [Pectobacterium aroidearum]MBA5739954.1 type II toxin-antitoxin system RelE/ParE family toxin [Pectobacterium aroidearum]
MFTIQTHDAAADELVALPDAMRGRMFRLIERLATEGGNLRMPHSRSIGGGLFELRIGDANIARALYVFSKGQQIFILHAFVKKTQKTPAAAIDTARRRLQEMIDDG